MWGMNLLISIPPETNLKILYFFNDKKYCEYYKKFFTI